MKNIKKILLLSLVTSSLFLMGCKNDEVTKITADPATSESPLSDLDSIFEGAPTNDELPEDGKFDAVYPATFDLVDYQSPIKSQGRRGVCSIFATVALMESLYLLEGSIDTPDFSEQFLQWSVKIEVGAFTETEGSNSRNNLRAISRYGIVNESVWPYEPSGWSTSDDASCTGTDEPVQCYTNGDPSASMLEEKRWMLPAGRYVNSSTRSIKAFMTENNQPVVAGLTFFYQSWNHGSSALKVNKDYFSEGYVLAPNAQDKEESLKKRAGHGILLVGWDDDLEIPTVDGTGNVINDAEGDPIMDKGFFIIKNSWGTSGFGIRSKFGPGYGYISYKYIKDHATVYGAGLPEVIIPEICDDGKDNDGDDDVDCDDTDCENDAACQPTGLVFSNDTENPIPDNNTTGLSSIINVDQPGTIGSVDVNINIEHTYIGDLVVKLIGPDGTEAILHDRADGSKDNIKATFTPAEFEGISIAGNWTLVITDSANSDTGNLVSWSLEFHLTGNIPAEICDDGVDNDGNGVTDCADTTCASAANCLTAEDIDITNDTSVAIPDGDLTGVESTIEVFTTGTVSSLAVSVDITHPFRGDLMLKLIHPDGTVITIFDLEEYEENLVRTFTPPDFNGTQVEGVWKLVVIDQYNADVGTLNNWNLSITVVP
jgi:subtilisin-like proprotein convertase family protein/C1A family cysteine protease